MRLRKYSRNCSELQGIPLMEFVLGLVTRGRSASAGPGALTEGTAQPKYPIHGIVPVIDSCGCLGANRCAIGRHKRELVYLLGCHGAVEERKQEKRPGGNLW